MIRNDFQGLTRAEEARVSATARGQESGAQLRQRLEGAGLESVAREFEKLFASQLVKELRNTLQDGFFGDGPGADTYNAWFDDHLGGVLADDGVFELVGILRAGLPRGPVTPAEELPK
jgi:Rod binding domain-containing protein